MEYQLIMAMSMNRIEHEIHLRHKMLLAAGWEVHLDPERYEVTCYHREHGVKTFEEAQAIYLGQQEVKKAVKEVIKETKKDEKATKLQAKGWKPLIDSVDSWEHEILGVMIEDEAYEIASK